MPRRLLFPIYAVAFFGSIAALIFLAYPWPHYPQSTPAVDWHGAVAALIGSLIVAIGWIVSSENTVRNAQRQHTITVMLKFEYDAEAQKRHETFRKYLPDPQMRVQPGDAIRDFNDPQAHELLAAVRADLNFMEFIAVGVQCEALDRRMVKKSLRLSFLFTSWRYRPYMDHQQRTRDADIWKAYRTLAEEWGAKTYRPLFQPKPPKDPPSLLAATWLAAIVGTIIRRRSG